MKIDKIITNYIKKKYNLEDNNIIEYIHNNYDFNSMYYFGTIININNNLGYTKIFLESLSLNTNFESIIFCFITDLDYDLKKILKDLGFSYILIKIKKNIENPKYLNYYIGNELLKFNSKFINILNNDYLIYNDYYESAKNIIRNFNKDNCIISLHNGLNPNNLTIKEFNFNKIKILLKTYFNNISLFYNKKTYELIKKFCIKNKINNPNNPINQISRFIRSKKYFIYAIQKGKLFHLKNQINNQQFKNVLLKKISMKKIETINNKKNIINNDKKQKENKNDKKQKKNKNDDKKQKIIYQKIEGGFGNQLFMLFNLISLSDEYNLKIMPYWDENYSKNYKKDNNVDRNPSFKYNILKNIKFYDKLDNDFIKYQEKEWKYNKIVLNKNKNYNISGYFQSYKYFWNNIKLIKNILNIDYKLINKIKKYYASFDKDIIAIHIRQGDYLNKQDYHPVQSLEYYKKALSYFDLEKHIILLFSDDYKNSCKFLKPLNLNYVDARDFSHNDEVQFYMLMLCNKKICANSSFSLMSCYLNEMFLFCENSEYIFPNKWFGIKGPEFNMDDLMLNYKFSTIDCYNFKIQSKFNVVSTLHIKDKNRYIKYLKYNKKYLTQYNKFYYIANENYNIYNSNFINENLYPFSKLDIINYLKEYIPDYRWGWYYQQLLKFYIFKFNNLEYDNVLIFDSDILILKNIHFFKGDKPILYKRNTGNGKLHIPYKKSINYILPDLSINESDSGICHMMIFNKKILDNLFIIVENYHKKDFWKVCLDSVIYYIKKYGYNDSILSEYELYYNFIKIYYKDSYIIKYNLLYKDISFDKFLKDDINNSKLSFIADHHYQSKGKEHHIIDNLMNTDDEILIKLIIKKYKKLKNKTYFNNNIEYHYKKTLFKKLFKYTTYDCFKNRLIKYFSENEINTIINLECKNKVIKFRKTIDNLIINYLKDKKQEKNNLINDIIVNNINLESDKFYFGIIIPVFNRYYVTKIFLECLKKNVNFDSVVFCIVDDGSNNDVLEELNDLKNSNIKCVIVQCKRQIDNIFGTDNTNIPGSLYPFTLYIGHEIIKNNCKILGVLDSDAIITPDYFKICKSFTKNLDMDNVIFSAFNSCSDCHKISGKDKINNTEILYKNMVGGISQFYSVELYNKFKYKFTGEESPNYWACDYDFQISNYMMKNNKKYVCLKNSIVQHIGIKSTMIRVGVEHNHNDSDIVDVIYNLLINPDTKKNINFDFDFDDTLRFDKDNIDSIFKNNILDKYMKK